MAEISAPKRGVNYRTIESASSVLPKEEEGATYV